MQVNYDSWCLLASDGLLELLQGGQLDDVLRKLIQVFYGAGKEAVFDDDVHKSCKFQGVLTSGCSGFMFDVDCDLIVEDIEHHDVIVIIVLEVLGDRCPIS